MGIITDYYVIKNLTEINNTLKYGNQTPTVYVPETKPTKDKTSSAPIVIAIIIALAGFGIIAQGFETANADTTIVTEEAFPYPEGYTELGDNGYKVETVACDFDGYTACVDVHYIPSTESVCLANMMFVDWLDSNGNVVDKGWMGFDGPNATTVKFSTSAKNAKTAVVYDINCR